MMTALKKQYKAGLFGLGFALIGVAFLMVTRAAVNGISQEAESGTLSFCTSVEADTEASEGSYVLLGTQADCNPAGANLPIVFELSSLSGTARFVSPTGSDSTGNGSQASPYATVAQAISAAASNDTIVVRAGTYREGGLVIPSNKVLHLIAYPGEQVAFSGAAAASTGWTAESSLRYRAYTPRPVTNGYGIDFINNQNLVAGGLGKYPDQVWVGTTQLRQVADKTSVAEGTFWVDNAQSRLYISATDEAKGSVEVSDKATMLDIRATGSSVRGITVQRYSNTASDGGVIKIYDTADNTTISHVAIYDSAFVAIQYIGSSNLIDNSLLEHATIEYSNWMGVNALYTDNLTIRASKISNMNQFNEFTNSPQSGALKTSRTRYTRVLNSVITNNKNHGLWFDQSNVDVDVAANWIDGNSGSGVFFEISDDLLLINNFIRSSGSAQPVKLAGSSGMKLVNNTIIGGADPIGIYTDERSKPGCADPAQPLCTNSYNSDRDTVRTRPATLDWMPRMDMMINNIIAYPSQAQYCLVVNICVLTANGAASAPIQTIFHQAEPGRGIPQTIIDDNVYANGTNNIIHAGSGVYLNTAAFSAAMATSPVNLSGIEAGGRTGNSWVNTDGTPTAALQAVHGDATPIPSDADINEYIPAGTAHYGVTFQ